MKSAKFFFILILTLTICIIFLDWVRNYYYPNQEISPIARIKTLVTVIAGITIMKLTFTGEGFKLFLVIYLILLLIYWILNFMVVHKICVNQFTEMLAFYKDIFLLQSPLPFIFFWFVDRMFFVKKTTGE